MIASIMSSCTTEKLIKMAYTDCKGICSYARSHKIPSSFAESKSISLSSIRMSRTEMRQKR